LFGAACAVACLINANGLEGLLHPLRIAQLHMLPLIDEWKPATPGRTPFFFGVLAVSLALILWKRPRLPWTRWLLLAALLGLALLQVRHEAMLAIVAAILLPQGFALRGQRAQPADAPFAWVAVGGAAMLVAIGTILPLQPADNDANPWKLIAAIPPELRSEHVLNDYSMGGPLILAGIRPYIDGRGDMYGDELVVGYSSIAHGDGQAFAEAVRHWDIRWVMLPNDSRLLRLIERSREWRLVAHDKAGAIYARR
jgi:hypothetical protein